jgi:hypothetical protein
MSVSGEPGHLRIFFSYAREDAQFVHVIAKFLAPLRIPVFVDTESIIVGDIWEDCIVDALDKATHVYVFWSKHAAESEWVGKEIDLAIGSRKVIIPVLIDHTTMPPGLSRHMAIDVAGVLFDKGRTQGFVATGKSVLKRLGVQVDPLLPPWQPRARNKETDPRLVAIALYGALLEQILRN